MRSAVTINPNITHGTPCFAGTRATIQAFFDHLEADYTIEEFRVQFPTIRRDHIGLYEMGRDRNGELLKRVSNAGFDGPITNSRF